MLRVKINAEVVVSFDGTSPNLLQFLEQHQQQVNYQCREGFCGACRCKLLQGQISYLQEPLAFVRRGEFLPCCSIPKTDIELEIPK
jgi:ferredoxin